MNKYQELLVNSEKSRIQVYDELVKKIKGKKPQYKTVLSWFNDSQGYRPSPQYRKALSEVLNCKITDL